MCRIVCSWAFFIGMGLCLQSSLASFEARAVKPIWGYYGLSEKGTVNGGVDYGAIPLSSPPPLHITQLIHTGSVALLVPRIKPDFYSVSWEPANSRCAQQYGSADCLATHLHLFGCQRISVQYKNRLGLGKVRFCCTPAGNDHTFPIFATYEQEIPTKLPIPPTGFHPLSLLYIAILAD